MQRIAAVLSGIVFSIFLATPVSAAPAAEPVTCTDGTTAPHGGKGACSKHGGIKKAEAAAEKPAKETKKEKKEKKKAAAAPASGGAAATTTPSAATPAKPATSSSKSSGNTDPSGATARCKDGTYSHAKTHQGACSRHGGVADWLDGSSAKH